MADIKIPSDLIFPPAESKKDEDLYRTLQDYTKKLNDTFEGLKDIEKTEVDDDSIEFDSNNKLQIKDGGVNKSKLNADVVKANGGLKQETDGSLSVSLSNTNPALEITDGGVRVKVDDSSIERTASGVQVKAKGILSSMLEDNLNFGTFPTTPSEEPSSNYQVANKKYIDDRLGGRIEVFLSNGSWTAPAGITTAYISGAGGGGGGAKRASAGAGGGGGGGTVINYPYTVTPGNSYNIVIGAGGTGATSNANGGNGSDTTFDGSSGVVAKGGQGGQGGNGGIGGGGLDAATTTGGNNVKGGNGAAAGSNLGGGGGASLMGKGANGGTNNAAANSGGGGGGGYHSDAGGNGGSGICIVMY